MKLIDLIHPDAILPDLSATERDEAIRELLLALRSAGAIDSDAVEPLCRAIIDREKKGSTGFGRGVALPHARQKGIERVVGAIGISRQGVDFRSLDAQPVYSIVLLISPAEDTEQHLAAMNAIWPNLNDDRFRRFLRQARSREEVLDLLQEADGSAG